MSSLLALVSSSRSNSPSPPSTYSSSRVPSGNASGGVISTVPLITASKCRASHGSILNARVFARPPVGMRCRRWTKNPLRDEKAVERNPASRLRVMGSPPALEDQWPSSRSARRGVAPRTRDRNRRVRWQSQWMQSQAVELVAMVSSRKRRHRSGWVRQRRAGVQGVLRPPLPTRETHGLRAKITGHAVVALRPIPAGNYRWNPGLPAGRAVSLYPTSHGNQTRRYYKQLPHAKCSEARRNNTYGGARKAG